MKKYSSPKIKLIRLDPKQAVLQVCMEGGVFFALQATTGTSRCMGTTFSTTNSSCKQSVKGVQQSKGQWIASGSADTIPS